MSGNVNCTNEKSTGTKNRNRKSIHRKSVNKKKPGKALLAAGVTLTAFFCLGGCGKKQTAMQAGAQAADSVQTLVNTGLELVLQAEQTVQYEPCTLTVLLFQNEGEENREEERIKAFEEEYPGIQIRLQKAEGSISETLDEVINSSDVPDVIRLTEGWLPDSEEQQALFYDLYEGADLFSLWQYGQKNLQRCAIGHKLYAVPEQTDGRAFLLQTDFFERAGVAVPETFDQLLKAGEDCLQSLGENAYPLALTEQDRKLFVITYLQTQYGKPWMVDGVLQYSTRELAEAFTFLCDMEKAHVIPTLAHMTSEENGLLAGWQSGAYGSIWVWNLNTTEYKAMVGSGVEQADFFEAMERKKGGIIQVRSSLSITRDCTHKREAALLLSYLSMQEQDPFGEAVKKQGMKGTFPAEYLQENSAQGQALSMVLSGLSYGDYNPAEAAQLLTDSLR